MKVQELTVDQLKALIEDTVDSKLQEYLGDPDDGLELREEVIQKLKAHKTSRKPRVLMADISSKHGLKSVASLDY